MEETAASRYQALEPLIQQVLQRLAREVEQLGFAEITLPTAGTAGYRLERDTLSGAFSLVGDWIDLNGHKKGSLLFHPDGNFLVEIDIAQPHPTKPRWFVEAVQAWGKGDDIKAEPKLLPALE